MNHRSAMLSVLAILPAVLLPGCVSNGNGSRAKSDSMPSFWQVDRVHGLLPNRGRAYCGPAAVSNQIMWLDGNGYGDLLPHDDPGPREQFELVNLLGSPGYMSTNPAGGTGPSGIMRGIERYCRERGYTARMEHQGWRSQVNTRTRVPGLAWMLEATKGKSNLVLNIGWYTYDAETKTYSRTGGHYVAVAGYEQRENGLWLLIHDPARRGGLDVPHIEGRLSQMPADAMIAPKYTDAFSAKGYHSLSVRVRRGCDCAIVDSAIAFSLERL